MKKIIIKLSNDDAEECVDLFRRVVETVDRLDFIAADLEELKHIVEQLRGARDVDKVER